MPPALAISMRSVDALLPAARNPRTHSPDQVAAIARSLQEFGWTNPVLVDGANGIIAGHGRVMAARQLGMTEVPVIELAHMTPEQKRAYIIADNQLALRSQWDDELLRLELGELGGLGFDLGVIGFEDAELERLLAEASGQPQQRAQLGALSDRFGLPPFSVLNAREGWWQDRKRAWLALGIQSELGRGAPIGGAPMPLDRQPTAAPGGSPMPAADYSKTKARGDGRGRAVLQ